MGDPAALLFSLAIVTRRGAYELGQKDSKGNLQLPGSKCLQTNANLCREAKNQANCSLLKEFPI